MAGMVSGHHAAFRNYPGTIVDTEGNVTRRFVTGGGNGGPNHTWGYYTNPGPDNPGVTGRTGNTGSGTGSGSGTSNSQMPRVNSPAPVQNVSPQSNVPNVGVQPGVAPIDVNSIMSQWRSIQNPMLPREAEIPYIDDTAAAQAAYGRAKDTAGQQGRGAMDALMDVQGARGIVGSGLGVNEAGGIIGAVNSNLADVNRERMIQAYETELARQTSNAGLRVSQRGQDIDQLGLNQNLLESLINIAQGNQSSGLTQRGQNIDVLQGNQAAGLSQRGQNIDVEQGNQSSGVNQRGQNIDLLSTLMRLYPGQQLPFQLG